MLFQRKAVWKGVALLIFVVVAVGFTLFLRNTYNSHFIWLIDRFGLPGIFGIGVFTNAPVIAPVTGFAVIPFVLDIARQHNDAAVIVLYALGGAVGESTGYLTGVAGKDITRLERGRFYGLLQRWFVRERRGRTFFLLIFLAFVTSPYDFIAIFIGGVRYPYPLFFLATFVGRIGKYAVIVLLGEEFCRWADHVVILRWIC